MAELRPVPSFFPNNEDDPFCRIIAGELPAAVIREWADAIAIVPGGRGPVVPDGHVLIIPKVHVRDMTTNPVVTGVVAQRAAELAVEFGIEHGQFAFNLGEYGGQTVWHLHGHLVIADAEHLHTMPWFGHAERDSISHVRDLLEQLANRDQRTERDDA